jgi:hypothetical protein
MRAIVIDPEIRDCLEVDIPRDPPAIAGWFSGASPHVAVRFPSGDLLLAARSAALGAFTVGGTEPIAGRAVLVGRREHIGGYTAARTALDELKTLLR